MSCCQQPFKRARQLSDYNARATGYSADVVKVLRKSATQSHKPQAVLLRLVCLAHR
jgi:hypothetical protein